MSLFKIVNGVKNMDGPLANLRCRQLGSILTDEELTAHLAAESDVAHMIVYFSP